MVTSALDIFGKSLFQQRQFTSVKADCDSERSILLYLPYPMRILSLLITVFTLLPSYCFDSKYKIHLTFCDQAPDSALQIVCSQLKKWDSDVRQHYSTSLDKPRSFVSSQRIWSASRSQWTNMFQSSAPWSPWSLYHNILSQGVQYPRHIHDKSILSTSHHVNLPILASNVTNDIHTSKEPKRVTLKIQHEMSSFPRQTKLIRVRDEQITNVKTSSSHMVSSLLSSTLTEREQTMKKNKYFSQTLQNGRITNGIQRPPRNGTTKKDLYAMEQDTVGPPGEQRPNNLIRKQFASSSPSVISSIQSSSIKVSNGSVGSQSFSAEVQGSRPFKRNQADMVTVSPLTVGERLKALECMDLICLCPFFHGSLINLECHLSNGKKLSMAIRKEYRQLNAEERRRFHSALNKLKRSGDYDKIAQWHSNPELSGGAHSGPAFSSLASRIHQEVIVNFL
ncbi:putative tyrosinase-like protein tyr-3 [Dirofilaria immitis]|nr:putative tyrosinase-like protein tyr-3 [Dirofilaria immitis]